MTLSDLVTVFVKTKSAMKKLKINEVKDNVVITVSIVVTIHKDLITQGRPIPMVQFRTNIFLISIQSLLFAENNQILLKIFVIPLLLNFM